MSDQWMHRLGSLHQWRGVDYVKHYTDGSVVCLLCGTGPMFRGSRTQHFLGGNHSWNYQQVKRAEAAEAARRISYSKIEWLRGLTSRIHSLGLPQWRQHVQSQMFLLSMEDAQMTDEQKSSILVVLEKYERMEVTSLLELALWKSSLYSDDRVDYLVLDQDFNTNEYAMVKRVTCGSDVVIPFVMSFLY